MVKIRLARGGAKKRPFYHVVVSDIRNKRDGRYIERLGFFNPIAVGGEVPLRLNLERISHWQGQGAQTSERVVSLIKRFAKQGEESAPARPGPSRSKPKAAPVPKEKAAADEEIAAEADAADKAAATADDAQADEAATKADDAEKADAAEAETSKDAGADAPEAAPAQEPVAESDDTDKVKAP